MPGDLHDDLVMARWRKSTGRTGYWRWIRCWLFHRRNMRRQGHDPTTGKGFWNCVKCGSWWYEEQVCDSYDYAVRTRRLDGVCGMSLATCGSDHDEVCYDDGPRGNYSCPVCDAVEEKDTEITDLKDEVSDLESKVESLETELEAARE